MLSNVGRAAAAPLSPCSAFGVSGALHRRNSNDHAVRCVVAAEYDLGGQLSLALPAGFAGVAVSGSPLRLCNVLPGSSVPLETALH
jgi:hypothetical protein